MTETPRDPFAPDPTPNPAPDPVPPPYDPPPVEPPTPVDPPEPAEPVEPVTPPDPITPPEPSEPPEPVTPPEPSEPIAPPEPISPPDPVEAPAPLEVPLPLGSRAEEPPPAYENAGDAEVVSAEEPAPLEPAEPEAPQPEAPQPEPGADAALPLAAAGTENLPGQPEAAQPEAAQPEPGATAALTLAAAGTENPPAPQPAPRRAWLPVAAVTLAVLLLAGATGWLGWQVRQQSVAEDGRPDAIAAARDAARLLFSYDHATLEEDFAKGLAVTTGEFRSEYSRTTKEVVTPVAQQYKAVVVAEVVEASIVEEGPGRATALVFLNQGTTSTRVQGQQVDQSRVRMQLVERDGRWLVRAVDAL